jgi:hypothetical protein
MNAVKKEDMRELVSGLLHILVDPLHSSDIEGSLLLKAQPQPQRRGRRALAEGERGRGHLMVATTYKQVT